MPSIRPATHADIAAMQTIGSAAGMRFAEIDDQRVAACADDDSFDDEELRAWIDLGRAWVAVDRGATVGFVVVDVVDGLAHIDEVSVHPSNERQGHGAALLATVSSWAATNNIEAVTLTTFADVHWNRPYYERRGFRVLEDAEIGPELAARVLDEDAHGLPTELRVCMGRTV